MKEYYGPDIHLNAYGHVDTDYYIAEARRMRAEAFAQLFEKLLSLIGIGTSGGGAVSVGPALKH